MESGVFLHFGEQRLDFASGNNALIKLANVKLAQAGNDLGERELGERLGNFLTGQALHSQQFLPQVGNGGGVALLQNVAVKVGDNVGEVDVDPQFVVDFFNLDVAVQNLGGAANQGDQIVTRYPEGNINVFELVVSPVVIRVRINSIIAHFEVEGGDDAVEIVRTHLLKFGNDLPNCGNQRVKVDVQFGVLLACNFIAGKIELVNFVLAVGKRQKDQLGELLVGKRFYNFANVIAQLFGKRAGIHLLQQAAHDGGTFRGGGKQVEHRVDVNIFLHIPGVDDGLHDVLNVHNVAVGKNIGEGLARFQNVGQVRKAAAQKQVDQRGNVNVKILAGGRIGGKRQVDQTIVAVNIGGKELLHAANFSCGVVCNFQNLINSKTGNVIRKFAAQEGTDVFVRQKRSGVNIGNICQHNGYAVVIQGAEDGVGQVGKVIVCRVCHKGFQQFGGNGYTAGFQQALCQCSFAGGGNRVVQRFIKCVGIVIVFVIQQALNLLHGGQSRKAGVKRNFAIVGNGGKNGCQIVVGIALGKDLQHLLNGGVEAAFVEVFQQTGFTCLGNCRFEGAQVVVAGILAEYR